MMLSNGFPRQHEDGHVQSDCEQQQQRLQRHDNVGETLRANKRERGSGI